MKKLFRLAFLFIAEVLICVGCGTSTPNCSMVGLSVSPSSANADHTVAAPGDKAQFFAAPVLASRQGCAIAACVNCWGQTWTVSDPTNVSISNNADDNGTGTCLAATNGGVTVTATAPASKNNQTITGTATLTCK